ncbi:UNVERIFIED_CONTAM: hypothetical protein Sradi_3484600 [Sesamum radiatum]|uniref:DNA-directed RNA polymerase n=1 Tax=Sesamum radiatum TaxID=300843 RepID=A0AAW2QDJ2_SESRA
MSISEDEKLSEMIKDYMELGSTITDSCFFPPPSQLHHHPIYFSLQEIMEETPEAEAEVYGKILFYLKDMEYSMDKPMIKLKKHWILLRLQMDNYEAHLCKTSWSTPFDTPSGFQFKGEYEYVEVMMREKMNGCKEVTRVIVDIDFRTQFELARPTPDYQQLTNALPMVFVGSEEKLEKLISLICSAAKQSLRERGLHIPPWRKASYMHSKWLSPNCKRVSISELNLSTYVPKIGNACFLDFLQFHQLPTYI